MTTGWDVEPRFARYLVLCTCTRVQRAPDQKKNEIDEREVPPSARSVAYDESPAKLGIHGG